MYKIKRHAAIIIILFTAATVIAQNYELKGWATTTGSGTLTEGNRTMFATFGQLAAGNATQGNYSMYMGVIRPGIITGTFSISGYVKYYWTPYRAVPNTEMNLTGGQILSTLTDVNGYYSFSNLTGSLNYTVTPLKTNTVNQPSVSSYDAALVLRHVVGSITLTPLQQIAGDVSNNGSLSSYDAALTLRYVVNMIQHFPAGDWKFQPTSISYTPLNSNQTDQNYAAILCGDVSGNWQPTDMIPKYTDANLTGTEKILSYYDNFINIKPDNAIPVEKTNNTTILELTSASTNQAIIEQDETALEQDLLSFPIELKQAKSVISADIILKYDPKTITLVDIKTTANTSGFLYAYTDQAGIIRIGLAGTKELNGNITLLNVRFKKNNATETDNESELTVNSLPVEVLSLMTNEQKIKESSDGVAGDYVEIPTRLSLVTNQPNPFKNQTEIRYGLPVGSNVSLTIYDVSGTMTRTLVNGNANPGFYSMVWNGYDERGIKMAPGVYFYVLKTDNGKIQRKMLMLK